MKYLQKTELANTMETCIQDYNVYGEVFSQQIFMSETWQEQTGCNIEDYKGYVSCCMNRLFDFKTWYEHSYSEAFPNEWSELSDYKFSVDIFQA